jgi:hypothetical protein
MNNTFSVPDGCGCMTQQGLELLREMKSMLSDDNVSDLFFTTPAPGRDYKKLLEKVKELEEVMEASLAEHEQKLLVLMRHYTHYTNVWTVHAPPDQAELQTVPWMVGYHNTTVAPKGELSKRTMDAPPTVQKSQGKEKGKRKNNKKKTA